MSHSSRTADERHVTSREQRLSSPGRRAQLALVGGLGFAIVPVVVGLGLFVMLDGGTAAGTATCLVSVGAFVSGAVRGWAQDAWRDGDVVRVKTPRGTVSFTGAEADCWAVSSKGQLNLVTIRLRDGTEVDAWGAEPDLLAPLLESAEVPRTKLRGGYWTRLIARLPASA